MWRRRRRWQRFTVKLRELEKANADLRIELSKEAAAAGEAKRALQQCVCRAEPSACTV
jgi:hypothetical protein